MYFAFFFFICRTFNNNNYTDLLLNSVVAQNLTASFDDVKVKEFCVKHELVINVSKTQLIVFKPLEKKNTG